MKMSPPLHFDVSHLHSLRLEVCLSSHQHCYDLVWYVGNILCSGQHFGVFCVQKTMVWPRFKNKQGLKTKKPNVPHRKKTSIMIYITEYNTNIYIQTMIWQEIKEIPGLMVCLMNDI